MKVLVLTRTPDGLPGGSGFHLRNMLDCLKQNGHECVYVSCIRLAYDAPFSSMEKAELIKTMADYSPDAVIADYSWMCSAFDVVDDKIIKICFVHDLRCRIVPCLTAIGYQDGQNWTEEKESALLRKAGILLVLNDEDALYCRRMAPDSKVIRIGIALEPSPHDLSKEVKGRCIYVGSNNLENIYALNWFLENVWPKVTKEVSHATCDVIMGHSPQIDERYAEAQIAIAPHIMKGGLKIKTAEAYAHGVPVVGNICAYDGFEVSAWATDDPTEMAASIVQFLQDDDWRMNMSEIIVMVPEAAYDGLLEVLK